MIEFCVEHDDSSCYFKLGGIALTRSQPLTYQDALRRAAPLDRVTISTTAAPTGPNAFTSRLSTLAKLSAEELLLLQGLGRCTRSHARHEELGTSAKPMISQVMLSGWACRQHTSSAGYSQIITLMLPGDTVGNLERSDLPSDDTIVALTPVITGDARALMKVVASGHPAYRGLSRAVQLLMLQETAMMRNQIVRLGRQTVYERFVHLILELHKRLQLAGMATSDTFPLPINQEVLSNVLGRSLVHTCRTVQQVRRDGLLEIRSGQVKILDMEAMQMAADQIPSPLMQKVSPMPGRPLARSA